MLQNIRDNSQGWIVKTIIGFIIVLFSIWGVEAIIGNQIFGQQVAVTVNGEDITAQELSVAMQRFKRDKSDLSNPLFQQQVMQHLIQQELTSQSIDNLDLGISDEGVGSIIQSSNEFQTDGQFDQQKFAEIANRIGLTQQQLVEQIRLTTLTNQMEFGLQNSAFVASAEVDNIMRLVNQTRDFSLLVIPADKIANEVVITDDELQEYYENNQQDYLTEEQISIEYIEINRKDLASDISITDQELQIAYDTAVEKYKGQEERQAAHILVAVGGDVSDQQAKEKIDKAAQRIEAGEDFATLAKELSEDSMSAKNGGDLGLQAKGLYDPSFDDALFNLTELNAVTEPIRTAYGYHLIKLLAIEKPTIPGMSALKEELTQSIQDSKVEDIYLAKIEQLENVSFASDSLDEPATELDLNVQTSELFGRNSGIGITSNQKVVAAAFSDDVLINGRNSSLIEFPELAIVLRVKEHKSSVLKPFAEVKEDLSTALLEQKTKIKTQEIGEQVLADLSANSEADAVTKYNLVWAKHSQQKRESVEVDQAILSEVFKLAKPQNGSMSWGSAVLPNSDYAVIKLSSVNDMDLATLEQDEKNTFAKGLARYMGQKEFGVYRQTVYEQADIDIQQ